MTRRPGTAKFFHMPHRIVLRLAVCLCALSLALALPVREVRADILMMLDQEAPDPVCTRWWNGPAPKLSKWAGDVVLLHFSDPSKLTSKAFTPTVRKLYEKYGDKGLHVVEILLVTGEEEADAYVNSEAAKWIVGLDADDDTRGRYLGSSVPRSYLIGPDGKVAWHAHVAALNDTVVQAQLDRRQFFDVKTLPQKVRAMARAAGEQRYGTALAAAEKLLADASATDEEKRVVAAVKSEIARDLAFQTKLLDKEIDERDWGAAWDRVDLLAVRFKGTPEEESIAKKLAEIQSSPRAVWVRAGQQQLDKLLEKAGSKRKKDIESTLRSLKNFLETYDGSSPGEKAKTWVKLLEERLAKFK